MSLSQSIDSGSFRDPDGYVFKIGSQIFRALRQSGLDSYRSMRECFVDTELEQQELVIGSWEIDTSAHPEIGILPEGIVGVLEQESIPFISYAYEWSFDMLKDAALLHLKLFSRLAKSNFILKDSTSFNVQFFRGKPIFIDVLSIAPYQQGTPWTGYSQFCQSFLFPLLVQTYRGMEFQELLKSYMDGIPIEIARKLLGIRSWFKLRLIQHVILQSVFQKSFKKQTPSLDGSLKTLNFSMQHILSLIDSIEKTIGKLSAKKSNSHWSSYQEEHSYKPKAFQQKRGFIEKHLKQIKPCALWDLGCNTGEISLLAANHATHVVAMDSDPESVNQLYLQCQKENIRNILPLVMDLANPSPGLGWELKERMSFFDRGSPNCVLLLALIHHLCISRNIPLRHLFQLIKRLGPQFVIIEFIPKSDPMVQQLLVNRDDVFDWYQQNVFEEEAFTYYRLIERLQLEDSGRILYCLELLPRIS